MSPLSKKLAAAPFSEPSCTMQQQSGSMWWVVGVVCLVIVGAGMFWLTRRVTRLEEMLMALFQNPFDAPTDDEEETDNETDSDDENEPRIQEVAGEEIDAPMVAETKMPEEPLRPRKKRVTSKPPRAPPMALDDAIATLDSGSDTQVTKLGD